MTGTLYRNELRSRALALLGSVGLCIAAVVMLVYMEHRYRYRSLLAEEFQGGCTIVLSLVAFALGFAQVMKEHTPGMQAFLLHRPISRTRIFFVKLAAALTLYFLIVLPPVAIAIGYAAKSQATFGPWVWPMALPSVADVFCGTTYVLAGMLIAARRARWLGSRVLPLGAAVGASALTYLPWLWVGQVGIAVAWCVLLPASWSAFVNTGRASRERSGPRVALAVSLMPAMLAIAPALVYGALELLRPTPAFTSQSYFRMAGAELYEVRNDRQNGRVLVDGRGKLVTGNAYDARVPDDLPNTTLLFDPRHEEQQARHYRLIDSYMASSCDYGRAGATSWSFYVYAWNRIACYEKPDPTLPPRLIGYLGENGLVDALEKAVPFTPRGPVFWQSGPWIVERDRVIRPGNTGSMLVFEAPAGEQMTGAAQFAWWQRPRPLVVTTDKATYVLDVDDANKHRVMVRSAHPAGEYTCVEVGADRDLTNFAFCYFTKERWWSAETLFVRVGADGEEIGRTVVPKLDWTITRRMAERIADHIALAPVLPLVEWVLHGRKGFLPMLSLATGFVSAGIVVWILLAGQVRRGAVVWFWAGVSFVLGWGGPMLMLAVVRFPQRGRCGKCGRRTSLHERGCDHCGAAFESPDPGPVAVFDSTAARYSVHVG